MDDEGDADPGPKWRSFRSEDELTQLVKRVVGEPLRIPPPSLAPQASEQIVSPLIPRQADSEQAGDENECVMTWQREEARQSVARVSEEFRKYRVRAGTSYRCMHMYTCIDIYRATHRPTFFIQYHISLTWTRVEGSKPSCPWDTRARMWVFCS
jgi:hypothetical protein